MDQDSKGYFTRSKAKKLADDKKNIKPHYAKKSIKFRKVVRIDHHDEDRNHSKLKSKQAEESIVDDEVKKDSCKIDITEDATNLLTAMILEKAFGLPMSEIDPSFGKNEDDDEDDEDYLPIEGLPEDVDYSHDEESYIRKLPEETRLAIIAQEKKLVKFNKETMPQRFKILQSDLDVSTKSHIIKKLDHFYSLETTDNEYHKLSQWTEKLNKLPFGRYTDPVVKMTDSSNKIISHLQNVKDKLDKAVFGHQRAKNQIIQIIAQQITNPGCTGNCIAIQGPPGNGKTTLVREGICKSINRPFRSIPLGGMQNSDFLLGHEYTYEGSKPGRIVEILMECGSMDPVIYFDELDKISESPKGEEIANLLCHLTDLSQNTEFHDKYFSGVNFDLSRAIFIFSYNDEKKVNPILLDRMIKIHTNGFKTDDKVSISKQYLIPSVCKSIGFNPDDMSISDETIKNIINSYTEDEKGVRNLRRCFETIISKINVLKLINQDIKEIEKPAETKNTITLQISEPKKAPDNIVSFNLNKFKLPININDKLTKKLIDIDKEDNTSYLAMYL